MPTQIANPLLLSPTNIMAPSASTTTATETMASKKQKNPKKLTLKKNSKASNGATNSQDNDENSVSTTTSSTGEEVIVVKSQSPPWKEAFDRISDQAFNVIGAAYLTAMMGMAVYYVQTQTDVDFSYEFQSALRLMMFHKHGMPFFGMLFGLISLRWAINKFMYPLILDRIYEGKNHKFTAHYCEWLFDAVKNTILFCVGAYVAYGSDWWPAPRTGSFLWYPPQGGTIFDNNGEIVPTKDLALETIGHAEVTVDFVALLTLIYDALTEYYEAHQAMKMRHADTETQNQAATTTSFAEDFVHHTGVCFGALFLYITAKDNCNSIAIIVLLGQFNDMCEFAALVLGLCKNRFLERVVTPVLCVFWTISLFYVWPAALIPIFREAIPIEHSFDGGLVLQITLYQFGSLFIAGLFWAMHMFWLYKGLLFLWRYNRGVSFGEKKLKFRKDGSQKSSTPTPGYGRTACLASGTMLKPTKEE